MAMASIAIEEMPVVRRSLVAAAALLTLRACARDGDIDETGGIAITRSACPAVAIPASTGDITLFSPPQSRAAFSLDINAAITNLRTSCSDQGSDVISNTAFDVVATRRDPRGAREVVLPYFVTVMRAGNTIVAKRITSVRLSFPDGQVRATGQGQGGAVIERAQATLPPDIQSALTRKRRAGDAEAALVRLDRVEVLTAGGQQDSGLSHVEGLAVPGAGQRAPCPRGLLHSLTLRSPGQPGGGGRAVVSGRLESMTTICLTGSTDGIGQAAARTLLDQLGGASHAETVQVHLPRDVDPTTVLGGTRELAAATSGPRRPESHSSIGAPAHTDGGPVAPTLYGDGQVSTTAQQGLVVLGVPDENVEPLVGCLEAEDLAVRPSRFRRGVLACTGLEFCKLAIVETKARSVDLYAELEKRLPDFDEPLTINVNGCPNSCARFQTGDIGLKGSIVDGVEGFQVHLGGSLGEDAGFGRKSRGLKVTADGAVDYVERLLRSYLDDRADGERFASWARRADESLLR